ncbi:RNA-binding domain-containing protein [Flavobacterium sp. TAB 87]|uniref:RNA-binding domain-containing protein n=1 Tax=Flavobacterium sp. TAB 87 TaxID=1729581 RepID=UPI00076C15B6|nr:RNA-binding domain-containing protein [Flavobacterium sp. TAB 87]KVV16412.1 Divergent AAA domain protein [Flavobacterium sp. TAB 87]
MSEADLKLLINHFRNQISETECVEFKEAKTNYDFSKLGKYFSALSNEANLKNQESAWLLFGIKDKPVPRLIVGSEYRKNRADLDSLKAEIANKITNRITFTEIHEITYPEGRVIAFQIPPAPKGIPVAWEGHYFGRDGEEIGALNLVELETIRSQSTKIDWSAQIIPTATIDDLDPKAIGKARQEYKEKNPKKATECETWDDITFLNKLKITIQGKITNTAILLLGREEASHFINPAVAKISWILKDEHNLELDYEHFSVPFLLNSSEVFSRIRNLTYRYIKDDSLFPTEVKMYDSFVIREALHNCIAHQDYNLQGRITVVEKPDELIFSNVGSFLPKNIETVIQQDAPQEYYRNQFLADAMVNLNMIDTIGSGIKRMFITQKNRFFPMPDFDLSDTKKVVVKIAGRIWDENYTKLLMAKTDLDLKTVVLLDRFQKSFAMSDDEIKHLKKLGLIEGRKSNLHISASMANVTGERSDYIKLRGLKDDHYKKMILEFLDKYKTATKQDIDKLILDILPDILDENKKANKVKNLVHAMSKKDQTIVNTGTNRYPVWKKV